MCLRFFHDYVFYVAVCLSVLSVLFNDLCVMVRIACLLVVSRYVSFIAFVLLINRHQTSNTTRHVAAEHMQIMQHAPS